ncbi:MAG: right-handed parallel beta-helix repeat-containing protein [Natrialbaceae archaeon]|nr:right-handed parallel beta-helix repeat-containing protein [Natrialbaceae archaeon]
MRVSPETTSRRAAFGIRVGGGTTNASISNNTVTSDTAIDVDATQVTISDNAVGGNGQSIAVGGGDSVVVTGNNASGNSRTGISLANVYGDSRVENNTIEANGDHGLTIRARQVEVRNNCHPI